MAILKNKIVHFLLIISAVILFDLISFEIAMPAGNTPIIIDENLKAGMTLKDAIQLLGPPEKIFASDAGTVVMSYDKLGLSLEIMNNGNKVEKINIQSSFKGMFATGIEIGADFQKILSAYNQPDIMTKEFIEYSDLARRFQLSEGKLTGAELYSSADKINKPVTDKAPLKETARTVPAETVSEEVNENMREALREELREEVLEELREEAIKGYSKDFDVFSLYGFNVERTSKGIIISEIIPGSAAEKGGLKAGEAIRKAFYEGAGKLNIYSVGGLEAILRRAVTKHKNTINILQDDNYYHKVEIPKIK